MTRGERAYLGDMLAEAERIGRFIEGLDEHADPGYDGEVFRVALSDVPERKDDLVSGEYELPVSDGPTTVAVKVIDMLGEEVVVVRDV